MTLVFYILSLTYLIIYSINEINNIQTYTISNLRMNFRWNANIDTSLQFSKNVRMY